VLHGSKREWLAYLHAAVQLIELRGGSVDPVLVRARSRAIAVIANHHNLLLALPSHSAERATDDRQRLAHLIADDKEDLRK
jgi:hypothetical protein